MKMLAFSAAFPYLTQTILRVCFFVNLNGYCFSYPIFCYRIQMGSAIFVAASTKKG